MTDELHDTDRPRVVEASLRVVRIGHGGNCSSVGSVVDTLFVAAAVGGALLAAICAAMQEETITVLPHRASVPAPAPASAPASEDTP